MLNCDSYNSRIVCIRFLGQSFFLKTQLLLNGLKTVIIVLSPKMYYYNIVLRSMLYTFNGRLLYVPIILILSVPS